ncbi:MAG TPA: hypothetical protein VES67_04335 [Vicinamibacterales bacterium]|nr:hypothetical protein [Vicinamibacterales bacterium]
MNDAGSPLFGSSKGRERGGSAFSLLRGRRSGDSDGLISFNLLGQESENPIPGRVSQTRLLLVEYWRRDQRAAAAAAQATELSAMEAAAALPASAMFVNGAPVTPPTPSTAVPAFAAQPPMAAQPAAEPRPTQAAYADPNRQDFLSSLKSKSRPYQSGSDAPVAASGSSSLIIESPSSHKNADGNGASDPMSQPAPALFVDGDAAPATPPARTKSLFEPRPRETAARVETESVFARVAAAMPPAPTPMPVEEEEIVAPDPNQPTVRALEAFLLRIETRRQQIESESVA